VRKFRDGNLTWVTAVRVRRIGRQVGTEEDVEGLTVRLNIAMVPRRLVHHKIEGRTQGCVSARGLLNRIVAALRRETRVVGRYEHLSK
jgi:hypothetical protein